MNDVIANIDPQRLYWTLTEKALRWIDHFSDSYHIPPEPLEKVYFTQFQLVTDELGQHRIIRIKHRKLPGGGLGTEEQCLLCFSSLDADNAASCIAALFAYVRLRLTYAARAQYRLQKRRQQAMRDARLAPEHHSEIDTSTPSPIEQASINEIVDSLRNALSDEEYTLVSKHIGGDLSQRTLASLDYGTRYRVSKIIADALATARERFEA